MVTHNVFHNHAFTTTVADGSSSPIVNTYETQTKNANGTVSQISEVNEFATRDLYGATILCQASINTTVMSYTNVSSVDASINRES